MEKPGVSRKGLTAVRFLRADGTAWEGLFSLIDSGKFAVEPPDPLSSLGAHIRVLGLRIPQIDGRVDSFSRKEMICKFCEPLSSEKWMLLSADGSFKRFASRLINL